MKHLARIIFRYVIIPVVILAVVLTAGVALHATYQKGRIARQFQIDDPGGIQEMHVLEIGGLDQWISIRGRDRANPVMLFLHGGPGVPETPAVRKHNSALEEHFVVVNWDQRGAGKSYDPGIPEETLNLEQFVSDSLDLTRWLLEYFDQDGIYLVGHSWGTMVGTLAAARHPELYHAYVGIGQAVSFYEGEKISYQYTLEQARERGEEVALRELEAIGEPPYSREDLGRIGVQRKWLFRFGGEVYGRSNRLWYDLEMITDFLHAPEYSLREALTILRGANHSVYHLWDDMLAVDLISDVPQMDLPVFFLMGRHDWVTVHPLVQKYYEALDAPHKELIWFEHSAHSPNFEQPDAFAEVMINRVLKRQGDTE